MKIRNKKTGEIIMLIDHTFDKISFVIAIVLSIIVEIGFVALAFILPVLGDGNEDFCGSMILVALLLAPCLYIELKNFYKGES